METSKTAMRVLLAQIRAMFILYFEPLMWFRRKKETEYSRGDDSMGNLVQWWDDIWGGIRTGIVEFDAFMSGRDSIPYVYGMEPVYATESVGVLEPTATPVIRASPAPAGRALTKPTLIEFKCLSGIAEFVRSYALVDDNDSRLSGYSKLHNNAITIVVAAIYDPQDNAPLLETIRAYGAFLAPESPLQALSPTETLIRVEAKPSVLRETLKHIHDEHTRRLSSGTGKITECDCKQCAVLLEIFWGIPKDIQ